MRGSRFLQPLSPFSCGEVTLLPSHLNSSVFGRIGNGRFRSHFRTSTPFPLGANSSREPDAVSYNRSCLGRRKMHIWPLLREVLTGPLGAALILWSLGALCLARLRRMWPLVVFLLVSASLLTLIAWQAYQVSGRHSVDIAFPYIMDGLFVVSGFGAILCSIFAALLVMIGRRGTSAVGPATSQS